MPEERLVKAVEISVFAHATEDEEKVKQAVKRLARFEPEFEFQRLSGHYEDPINLLTAKTVKKKEATNFLANILDKFSSLDKSTLVQNLPNHIDQQGSLYIRLDKQKAYHGRAVIAENDPIRVKFKFQLPHKADPVVVVREFILNLEAGEE